MSRDDWELRTVSAAKNLHNLRSSGVPGKS